MQLQPLLDRLVAVPESDSTIVTLSGTLNRPRSRILSEDMRLFLKDRVLPTLLHQGYPPGARSELNRLVVLIGSWIEGGLGPPSTGLYLVAGPGLWEVVELQVPVANVFHVGRTPYLAPLVQAIDSAPRVLVLPADVRGATLEALWLGSWTEIDRWESWKLDRDTERILSGRSPSGLAVTFRARAGIGGGKRDRFEQSLEAEAERTLDLAARRLAFEEAMAPAAALFLFGEAELFRQFLGRVPLKLKGRVELLGMHPHGGMGLRNKVEERLAVLVERRRQAEICEFHDRRAQGYLVAFGPADVLAHRTDGKLARVYLCPEDPVPGVQCLSCSGLHAVSTARCGFCGGAAVPVSLTNVMVAHSLKHPPVAITFVPWPATWLADLGGMAGLLSPRGNRTKKNHGRPSI